MPLLKQSVFRAVDGLPEGKLCRHPHEASVVCEKRKRKLCFLLSQLGNKQLTIIVRCLRALCHIPPMKMADLENKANIFHSLAHCVLAGPAIHCLLSTGISHRLFLWPANFMRMAGCSSPPLLFSPDSLLHKLKNAPFLLVHWMNFHL